MLKFEHIHKSFGPVEVLKDITLELSEGKLLGLIGENGAGKSTLMNIIGGVLEPSGGRVYLDGQLFKPAGPGDALKHGIAFIHQELNLFPNLTIGENLFLANLPRQQGILNRFISYQQLYKDTKTLLQQVGLELSPTIRLGRLTTAQRQLVEIAKALAIHPRLIIFDEPTTSLSRHESEQLFGLIGQLKARGIAMIYISHQLEDVLQLSDHIAILRDGKLVGTGPKEIYDKTQLVELMVGRSLDNHFPDHHAVSGSEIILETQKLSGRKFKGVSLQINTGEIVGMYGLIGAGRSEFARAVFGLDAVSEGTVFWKERAVQRLSPTAWIKKGLVFLTEDRREDGLLLTKNIRQNVQLAALRKYTGKVGKLLDRKKIREVVSQQVAATKVHFQDLEQQTAAQLSGGNQQKVVLAKWLLNKPEFLILDEPTKGIDIGAKEEIYQLIRQLTRDGVAVLLISSEIEELLGMCDRILVMNAGRIRAEFTDPGRFDRSAILKAALPEFVNQNQDQ